MHEGAVSRNTQLKLKEFADDNYKLDENGRKLSKWVENTGGKALQCFQKTYTANT